MSHPGNDRIIDDIRDNQPDCQHHIQGDGSWWEYDGQGITLCRVCSKCKDDKLSKYEPWVLGHYTEQDCECSIEEDN